MFAPPPNNHCDGLDSGGTSFLKKEIKGLNDFYYYNEFDKLCPRVMRPCTYFRVKDIIGEITDETYLSALEAIDAARVHSKREIFNTTEDDDIQADINDIVDNIEDYTADVKEILKRIFSDQNMPKIRKVYPAQRGGRKRNLSRKTKKRRRARKTRRSHRNMSV